MDSAPEENFKNYCRVVLALEYHDGPTLGVGTRLDGSGFCFRLIGWDKEHWHRAFIVVPMPSELIEQVFAAFAAVEAPRAPIWCPSSDGHGAVQERINDVVATVQSILDRAARLVVVVSRNLVGEAVQLTPSEAEAAKLRDFLLSRQLANISLPVTFASFEC